MKTIFIILGISIFLFSCDLCQKTNNEEEPPYKARIAWDSKLPSNDFKSHTVDGDSVFFYERPPGYDTVNIYALTRLDAETGRLVWRSEIMFSNIIFCQPIAAERYVYVFLEPNGILCFNRETGEHTATVIIDIENKRLRICNDPSLYRQHLYIGLSNSFVYLDVNTINHNGDPDTVQYLTPEIIWLPETKYNVAAKPIVYKDIVYTATSRSYGDRSVDLVGFDTDTKQMVFHAAFGPDDNVPYPEFGGVNAPIFIHEDVLYYLSRSVSAWNLRTGELLYRHVFTWDTPKAKMYMSSGMQPVYYQGKLFFITAVSSSSDLRNIHCIDATTGKLVWNNVAKDPYTLHSNIVIAHGKLYMSQDSGIWVYEPETGKCIGVDKSFCGAMMGRHVLYKDYMICVRKERNGYGNSLVAVYVGE